MKRRRYERVEGEQVEPLEDTEPLEGEEPLPEEGLEPLESDVEVVGGPAGSNAEPEPLPLPQSPQGLERIAVHMRLYRECLASLAAELRRRGLLNDELRREIGREKRYADHWLALVALQASRLGLCHKTPLLEEVCEKHAPRSPGAASRGPPGAENPMVLLAWMKRLLPQCYRAIVGSEPGP